MKKLWTLLLSAFMAVSCACTVMAASPEAKVLSVDAVESIQPYSELTYYAVAVTKVEINYKDGVDLSGVSKEDFHLIDRGYLKPDFGELPIETVEVDGQTVTLTINRDTAANTDNTLIYTGTEKEGDRAKDDVFGVHACFSWYRQLDGTIVEAARAFQYRDTELKFWHEGEDPANALCQAEDATGKYIEGSKIQPTDIEYFTNVEMKSFEKNGQTLNYTKGGFMTLEELGIQVPSSSGIEGDYIKALVAFPENYDPNKQYPIVMSLPGNNAAYWDIIDEEGNIIAENPYGHAFFNGSSINWYEKGVDVIAIYISHRYYSQYAPAVQDATDLSLEGYNQAKDDMAVIDYFIENYNANPNHVVLTGDSRGTKAACNVLKAFPGRISTFLCINGSWGGWPNPGWGSTWNQADFEKAAEYGLSVWCWDGEQDFYNTKEMLNARETYAAAGWSPEEIDSKLRISCLDTRYNYYWAETDHSATKFVYWYLMDKIYHGPGRIENMEIVYDNPDLNDTYQMTGYKLADGSYTVAGFDYKVYQETLIDWVMSEDREIDAWTEESCGLTVDDIVSVQPYSKLNYYAVGVETVEITYKDGVDLSNVTAEDYHLIDRGYLKPYFGELPIASVDVNGQVVTLTIKRDTAANADNTLIYTGTEKEGERAKDDIFGVHACFSWYRQLDGKIVEAARAFQYRDTELKLWHRGETRLDALCQADNATGKHIEGSKIQPTEIEYFTNVEMKSFEKNGQTMNYTKGGFMTLEELGIQVPSSSGKAGDYIKALVAFPENYDPNKQYPIVMSLPGNNAAYWDIIDEEGNIIAENPYGHAFFNGSSINWYEKGVDVIAIYISHRYYSQYAPAVQDATDLSLEGYNQAKDDMAVIDYFIENYNANPNHVVLTGDSRGTKAACNVIKAFPNRISTFLCINGSWGGWPNPGWGSTWNQADFEKAAEYGLSVWCWDGELDFYNTEPMTNARATYAAAGWSPEEIDSKLRISCLDTRYNYYWAETDHSATKFVYWYLMDKIYHGPGRIENMEIVYDNPDLNDTYQMTGYKLADGSYTVAGFDYKVYQETLIDWVLSEEREIEAVLPKKSQKITTAKKSYKVTYGDKAFTLDINGAEGKLSFKSSDKKVVTVSKKGKVSIKGAGTAYITVKAAENEKFEASNELKIKVSVQKAPQKINVKTATASVKAKNLVKAAKSFNIKCTGAKGKLTCSKVSGSAKLKVSKAGKVTVAKGTKKGTYKIKVKVAAAATANYKAASVTKTIKVTVK